jgi:shikimate kinase
LSLPLFDLDAEIEKATESKIKDIFAEKGEPFFRELEQKYLYDISKNEAFVLSCGGGTPCFFDNMDFMNKNGITVWLNAPVPVMVDRLKRKKDKRPLLNGLTNEQLTDFVIEKLEERRPFYNQSQLVIDPVNHNVNSITEKIRSCTNLI